MAKAKYDQENKDKVLIECPGCGHLHVLTVLPSRQQNGAAWGFNGDMNRPTFTPSLLVTWGKYADPHWKEPEGEREIHGKWSGRCHSYITDGRIQFLSDCTHELAGQTVDLPEVKEY